MMILPGHLPTRSENAALYDLMRARFEAHAMPEPNSGCWLWMGAMRGDGYGTFYIGTYKAIGAHRAAWQIFNGPIRPGLQVCHKCDVCLCVNPDHLFLGTAKENAADRERKGRGVRGEQSSVAKLSEAAALAVKHDPRQHQEIARDHSVSRRTVSQIKRAQRWRHLDQEPRS